MKIVSLILVLFLMVVMTNVAHATKKGASHSAPQTHGVVHITDAASGGGDADPDEFSTNGVVSNDITSPAVHLGGDSFYDRFVLDVFLEWVQGFFKRRAPGH